MVTFPAAEPVLNYTAYWTTCWLAYVTWERQDWKSNPRW